MMGVAGLAVLGMTAKLAGVQTVEARQKPPLYRYVSYWTVPLTHWAELDQDHDTGNQKLLARALADDEMQVHAAEGFTHDNWWQASSIAGLMKVLEASHKGGGSSSPLLVSSTRHWDQIYISRRYNWKAGSWKGAYGCSGTYKLKPDAPEADDAVRTLSSSYVPVFEKMLADGIVVEYEIDREIIHTVDSQPQVHLSFVMSSGEGLDRFRASLGAVLDANSLIGLAFGSMMVNFTPQAAFVKINATYK
jgi:hypothetical protein